MGWEHAGQQRPLLAWHGMGEERQGAEWQGDTRMECDATATDPKSLARRHLIGKGASER